MQDRLDTEMLTTQNVKALHRLLTHFKKKAKKANASSTVVEQCIALYMAFGPGNCNRPDVVTNATIGEFTAWNKDPAGEFKVQIY